MENKMLLNNQFQVYTINKKIFISLNDICKIHSNNNLKSLFIVYKSKLKISEDYVILKKDNSSEILLSIMGYVFISHYLNLSELNLAIQRKIIDIYTNTIKNEEYDKNETDNHKKFDYRTFCNNLINKISKQTGQSHKNIRKFIYAAVSFKGSCNLDTKLHNLKKKAEKEGISKNRIKNINKLDVIFLNNNLKNIYIDLVKSYAIKYNII